MLPQGFPERMLHLLGEAEFAEFLASYERPRSAGLRLNPRKPLPDGASLPFCEAQVPWEPNGYYVCEGSRPGLHPWHDAGAYYLQEPSAMAPARLLDAQPGERVLDLCAGTGCLGLGVKRFCPAAQVTSLEKSPAAYRYLEQNAHLSPALTITPVQGDLFTYWQTLPEGQLDLIVSNPPYLTAAEMGELQPEVAQEPAMALEAGEDGLVFYRAIAEHYRKALRPGGALALEIGWQQREAVTALLAANGWTDIVCRKDFGGNDRCVMARKR